MGIQLEIPDSVLQAMRLPANERRDQVLLELATTLYARGILSFGKARELAGLGRYEFGILLGRRGVPRHYGDEEFQDDLNYARRQ